MAAELIAPSDPLTGGPLFLAVPDDQELQRRFEHPAVMNLHHTSHEKAAPELQSLGGKAVRATNMQLVPAELHNMSEDCYHSRYKRAPLFAADDQDKQFIYSLLGVAGYISPYGVDVWSSEGQMVRLNDRQIAQLRAPMRSTELLITQAQVLAWQAKAEDMSVKDAWRALRLSRRRQARYSYENVTYGYVRIREFYKDYLMSQDIDISPKIVKKFLSEKDPDLRRARGETLLGMVTAQSTAQFEAQYRYIHEQGLLHPLMPPNPAQLVLSKLGNFAQRAALMPQLEQKLVTSLD